MRSLSSLSLLALLTSIPSSHTAPTKRQQWGGFGGRGWDGRPGPGSRPHWFDAPAAAPPAPAASPDNSPAPIVTPDTTKPPSTTIAPAPANPVGSETLTPQVLLTTAAFTPEPQQSSIVVSIETTTSAEVVTTAQSIEGTSLASQPSPEASTPQSTSTTTISPAEQTAFIDPSPDAPRASSTQQVEPVATATTTTANSASVRTTSSAASVDSAGVFVPFPNTTSTDTASTTSTMSSFSTTATFPASAVEPETQAPSSTQPTSTSPSSSPDITVGPGNTLNGTFPGNNPPNSPPQPTPGLNLELVNNFGVSNINIYITAKDDAGRVMIFTPSGTWFYPTSSSRTTPQPITENIAIPLAAPGATTTLNLPGYFNSGRIYIAAGSLSFYTLLNDQGVTIVNPDPMNPSDPSYSISWAFVEMTYTSSSGLFANLSFVDFVGLPLAMQLTSPNAATQTVQGTTASSVDQICAALQQRATEDGQPWDKLCHVGSGSNSGTSSPFLRVNSPSKYIAAVDNTAFTTYWDAYVTSVWAKYASEPLIIDTQSDAGQISCSTASGNLVCPGATRPLPAPLSTSPYQPPSSALSIFSCAGIFSSLQTDNAVDLAILPRLCAALNRSTLLLAGGNVTPSAAVQEEDYYLEAPTNWYSKAVHDAEVDGRGYAFAYDDVAASGGRDVSGTVAVGDVGVWRVFVGGMSS